MPFSSIPYLILYSIYSNSETCDSFLNAQRKLTICEM